MQTQITEILQSVAVCLQQGNEAETLSCGRQQSFFLLGAGRPTQSPEDIRIPPRLDVCLINLDAVEALTDLSTLAGTRRESRGGTPLCGLLLYGDVPLDRVWFLASLP